MQTLIEAGVELARERRTAIDSATARMIAHALSAGHEKRRSPEIDEIERAIAKIAADYAGGRGNSSPSTVRSIDMARNATYSKMADKELSITSFAPGRSKCCKKGV